MGFGHHDSYEYPTFQQMQAQVPHMIDLALGRSELTTPCKVKSGHTVLSWGLGMVFPHDGGVQGGEAAEALTDAQAAEALGSILASGEEGVRAIPWKAIIAWIVKKLLEL